MPAPWRDVSPPAAIAGLADARPIAPLEFSRAWLGKMEQVRLRRTELQAAGLLDGMAPRAAAAAGAALAGTLRVPVVPIHYADVPVPFAHDRLASRLFGANVGDTVSYRAYFEEVSGGLLDVTGLVAPWITLEHEAEHYLDRKEHGWGRFGRIAELREEALRAADRTLDFAEFDNDGPDGIPNSGDDDGFVDFVAIVYAVKCPGDGRAGGIWPHRAAMAPLATGDRSVSGEPIRITDYVILPAIDEKTCGPLHIGVLAHETGHALGLPDLYDYDGSSQGIGAWGLMGTGSHASTYSPAHPSAWEKEQLGWVQVDWLASDTARLAVPPVHDTRAVLRYDVPDRNGEYLLLENRQKRGSDADLPGHGLLVWRVDPERGELGAWNRDERRAALGLVEADGKVEMVRGLRADNGDPFPGNTRRRSYVADGVTGGFAIANITERNDTIVVDVSLGYDAPTLVPRARSVRLTALEDAHPVTQFIPVQREGGAEFRWRPVGNKMWLSTFRNGDTLAIVATPTGLKEGLYSDTVHLRDARGVSVAQVHVSFYVAAPGVGQIVATDLPWSWGLAVENGRILQASYGWDALGLRPRPRVLQLWEGATHPATLVRLPADALYAPVVASSGVYVIARARNENMLYRLGDDGSAQVVARAIGNGPAYGAAALPDGDLLVAEWSGTIHRVSPSGSVSVWADVPAHIYQIAIDAAGNVFAATFEGDVLRVEPDGSASVYAVGFGRGKLVALAATPAGDLYAAERGGQGRIVRVRPDGSRQTIFRRDDAHYYGITVDNAFVYALDLRARQILRIPLERAEVLVRH